MKRIVFWLIPAGSNMLISSERISTYSMPSRRSAAVGCSPERATRFGRTGAYRKLVGKVHFSLDPAHPRNQAIIDLSAAPKRDDGRVAFSADLFVLEPADRLALLALQGPLAVTALERLCPAVTGLKFMFASQLAVNGISCTVSRSGYTGEDGFEISAPANRAVDLAQCLLDQPEVKPVGLGARDSLRLEAGLCLYGHDIDETTSPVEAGLSWTIPRPRREAADFPGAARILRELADGPARKRVGLRPEGRAPAREGSRILDKLGMPVGVATMSPSQR